MQQLLTIFLLNLVQAGMFLITNLHLHKVPSYYANLIRRFNLAATTAS